MPQVPFKNYVILAISLAVIAILAPILLHSKLPPQVPLFYGLPESDAQLASSWALVIPGIGSLILTFTNTLISTFLEDEFLKKALVAASNAGALFAIITTVKIIFLVGSF